MDSLLGPPRRSIRSRTRGQSPDDYLIAALIVIAGGIVVLGSNRGWNGMWRRNAKGKMRCDKSSVIVEKWLESRPQ